MKLPSKPWMRASRVTAIALLIVLAQTAPAALVWEAHEIAIAPALSEASTTATFGFVNTGTAAVTIKSVKPSCSCTTAALAKTVYAPGEAGAIVATFVVGDRVGEQRKTISVKTDDPDHPDEVLTLVAHLPPQPMLSPRILAWDVGSAAETKAVTITIPDGVQATVDRATVVDAHGASFSCEVVAVAPGRRYEVRVAPVGTATSGSAKIEITTSLKTYHAYARIRNKPADGAPASHATSDPAPAHARAP
jgi:hypothetical protein